MPAANRANRTTGHRSARPALFGILAALALGLALAGCAGAAKTPQILYMTPTPEPTPEPTPTPEQTPTPEITTPPSPTPAPTTGPCVGWNLGVSLKIVGGSAWQTSSAQQVATIEMRNNGPVICIVKSKNQAFLLNGDGSILLTGPVPSDATNLMLDPGSVLKTSVQTSNLCGAAPVLAPVRVAFMFPGTGLVTVEPASASDVGAVPSCAGAAGTVSGDIQMTSWAP
jgi:hypothetical protein